MFEQGIEFEASEIDNIEKIEILADRFMTIENKTSYMRMRDQNTVFFYLGGYSNRFQRDFIKKVYISNPNKQYFHFGDIDAGGFWIHNNLNRITGIQFRMYCMSEKELKDPKYQNCLHKLTENDIKRLKELKEMDDYRNVVRYMLENDVKLEQEIISLNLNRKIF